jgi:hypothetical protein
MPHAPIRRPSKTKAAGFVWRGSPLAELLSGTGPAHFLAAHAALVANRYDTTAIVTIWHYANEFMKQPAAALGLDADSPTVALDVVIRLGNDRRIWSEPAAPAGRPRKDDERAALAPKVAAFVSEAQARNPARSDAAWLDSPEFLRLFPEAGKMTRRRKLLAQGRNMKNQAP